MARGVKTGGRDFKKGDPATKKGGRKKMPADLSKVKTELSKEILTAKLKKFLLFNREELKSVMEDKKAPMIDVTICSIIAKAATGADHQRLDWVVTRLIGRVPDKIEADITTTIQVTPANAADLYNIARRSQVIELAGDDDAD